MKRRRLKQSDLASLSKRQGVSHTASYHIELGSYLYRPSLSTPRVNSPQINASHRDTP